MHVTISLLPDLIDWRNQFDAKYAALYYPWLQVPDPLALEGFLSRCSIQHPLLPQIVQEIARYAFNF